MNENNKKLNNNNNNKFIEFFFVFINYGVLCFWERKGGS